MYISSSLSSCRTMSTEIPDPLSPLFPILHCFRQVFKATSRIGTELLSVGSSRSSCLCSSMCRVPQEYITYESVLTYRAVSCMFGSSNLDSFVMGGRWPYSCRFMGCCLHNLINIARSILVYLPSSLFSISLVSVHVAHPYSCIDTTAAWKKLRFILSVRSDFHITDCLSISAHAFASYVLMAFSVDVTQLPR